MDGKLMVDAVDYCLWTCGTYRPLQVVLETEVTNSGALNLYTKLGFSKNERLIKYYLNGVDAFRLKLWFR